MFRIVVNVLAETCSDLEVQIRRGEARVYELQQVLKNIASLSGTEEVLRQLRQDSAVFEDEVMLMKQMQQALNKSLTAYLNGENRILNECEQNNCLYAKQSIEQTDLQGMQKHMKAIAF